VSHLAIIADDLTGAMDTGLQFAKHGQDTVVAMSHGKLFDASVLVIDTDSRAVNAREAERRLATVCRQVADRRVYKKIDSTVRGNIGHELRSLLDVLTPRAVVVAPAFPAGGRTTVGGRQFVDGHPLEETFFAHDSRWPMHVSHVPTILGSQSGHDVGHIDLGTVMRGSAAIERVLSGATERIIVADAIDDHHLAAIAQALVALGPAWVPCGSAGLANAWALSLDLPPAGEMESPPRTHLPVLAVCGSRNDTTIRQIHRAEDVLVTRTLIVDPGEWGTTAACTRACVESLSAGQDVLLAASLARLVPGAEEVVSSSLAEITAAVIAKTDLAGLFLTGGDIAIAVCRALGAGAVRILAEVQPGVPGGRLMGGPHDCTWVVTKAGGFGDTDALVDAICYLRGELPSL